ncbi:DUF1992 domain-containing protein [Amycolatopsis taiwanensis]|nr:DUF1992 domain-containing protein [Amycolatopsis taiwanensis]
MTERKPTGMSSESWVERQIREATEAGEFDNLPGRGRPLPGLNQPYDENWWIRRKMEREGISTDALLPTPLRLRKEILDLPASVRPLRSEKAVREVVGELNKRIMNHLRVPSGPDVPVRPVDADAVVEQWKADRAAKRAAAQPAVPTEKPRSSRWWHRLFALGVV